MKGKVLVLGGSGFLGSHVADTLSEKGMAVSIFDINKPSTLRGDQKFIQGDILNRDSVAAAVQGHDFVYHLAGIADIDECAQKPIETMQFNVVGTAMVLEACIKHQVKKFIFASSAYVYSNSGSFYRVSKQACENLIEAYNEKSGLKYVILRYGSLYGPRSDRRNSLYRICEDALTKHKITYGGTGEEKREFIHVQDAAEMSYQVLAPEFDNQHIILTGADAIRYNELLSMVKEMLSEQVEIEYQEKKNKSHYSQSPYSFSPKLGKKLTLNPRIDLGQGLLNLLTEIHEKLHPELQEKFGLLINQRNGR